MAARDLPVAALVVAAVFSIRAAAQEPDADTLTVVTAEGQKYVGTLAALSDEMLSLDGDPPLQLRVADLRAAEFSRQARAEVSRGSLVLLANGDRLALRPVGVEDDRLVAEWVNFPHWGRVSLPLEGLRAAVLRLPEVGSVRRDLLRVVTDPGLEDDVVVLENGDRLAGVLAGLDAATVTLEADTGVVEAVRESVRAIGFNPALTVLPEVEGPRVLLTLIDGSELTANGLALHPGGLLKARSVYGAELELPVSAVAKLQFLGGRVVYLSDLEPENYAFTPYLGSRWELGRNRSADGGPLRLGGVNYARGLGMHSRSRVTYDLGGQYASFTATAGLDDETGRDGNVVLSVEVDGEPVWSSGVIDGGEAPVAVGPIDVRGRERLTLVVDFGERGDIQDHVNWCDAAVVAPAREE